MIIDEKYILKELKKEDLYFEDSVRGWESYHLVHTDKGGYTENELEFNILKDGSFSIDSERESYGIYLYSEQVKHLQMVLDEIKKMEQ